MNDSALTLKAQAMEKAPFRYRNPTLPFLNRVSPCPPCLVVWNARNSSEHAHMQHCLLCSERNCCEESGWVSCHECSAQSDSLLRGVAFLWPGRSDGGQKANVLGGNVVRLISDHTQHLKTDRWRGGAACGSCSSSLCTLVTVVTGPIRPWLPTAAEERTQPRGLGTADASPEDRMTPQPRVAKEEPRLLATSSRHFFPPSCNYSFPFLIKICLTLQSGHGLGFCLNLCFLNCNSAILKKCELPLISAF